VSILTLDDYIGSVKQVIPYSRTATRTTVANVWFTLLDTAGNPGSGTLAAGNTTAGVVPVAGVTGTPNGYPYINFTSGNGYLATVDFGSTVACRLQLVDTLYAVGAFAYNSTGTNTTTSPPSYSGRVPGGTDYGGTQIWLEVTTAFVTGNNWTVAVVYMNQDGTSGQSTGATAALAAASLTLGKLLQLPLASGDTGVQKIEKVIVTNGSTAMTAGNFNILVVRPLWNGRVNAANSGDNHGIDRSGLPQLWATSALALWVNADSTSSGLPDCAFEIASN
jgi:hypothetical protein